VHVDVDAFPLPVLVYIHGGAFALLSAASVPYDTMCCRFYHELRASSCPSTTASPPSTAAPPHTRTASTCSGTSPPWAQIQPWAPTSTAIAGQN
jgi:hypothetical protein